MTILVDASAFVAMLTGEPEEHDLASQLNQDPEGFAARSAYGKHRWQSREKRR